LAVSLRHADCYLSCSTEPSFADHFGIDEAKHVELGDDIADATLGERTEADLGTQGFVIIVNLAGEEGSFGRLIGREDAVKNGLELLRLMLDNIDEAITLNFFLSVVDVFDENIGFTGTLGQFSCNPYQFEGSPGVAMLSCSVGSTLCNDSLVKHLLMEGEAAASFQNLLDLQGIIRGEDELLFTQRGFDPRIKVITKCQII
jgi:hypothetical protein